MSPSQEEDDEPDRTDKGNARAGRLDLDPKYLLFIGETSYSSISQRQRPTHIPIVSTRAGYRR